MNRDRVQPDQMNLITKIVGTNKVFKTHKGGKTASWNALVIVGDGAGNVGAGLGKARGVPDAIRKGEEAAKRSMVKIPMIGPTIPHQVVGRLGSALVLLKPASPGTGVIAGGAVRAILECGGVRDVLAKSHGSRNAINMAWATIDALQLLKDPLEIAKARGQNIETLMPWYNSNKECETNA